MQSIQDNRIPNIHALKVHQICCTNSTAIHQINKIGFISLHTVRMPTTSEGRQTVNSSKQNWQQYHYIQFRMPAVCEGRQTVNSSKQNWHQYHYIQFRMPAVCEGRQTGKLK